MENKFRVYGYRWVVLIAYMLLTLVIELQWLSHAPIARAAAAFYADQIAPNSLFKVDLLTMIYMFIFILFCIPASYIINKKGITFSLRLAAILTGGFGILKGMFAASFFMVLMAQIGLAIAQPLLLNAVTVVTVRWFPLRERGMAAGLIVLAQYAGIFVAMVVAPQLVNTVPDSRMYGQGIDLLLLIYGIFSLVVSIAAFILIKESPKTPPSADSVVRVPFFQGFKYIFLRRDMLIIIALFFLGSGVFNSVSSMVDAIAKSLGMAKSTGVLGALLLIGGMLGTFIIPVLSDRFRKRKFFFLLCIIGIVPGIAGLQYADLFFHSPQAIYRVALGSSFMLGFFLMSAGPLGFQYAAELSYPANESSTQGVLVFVGQLSGLLFAGLMSLNSNQYLDFVLQIFLVGAFLAVLIGLLLKESPVILTEDERLHLAVKKESITYH